MASIFVLLGVILLYSIAVAIYRLYLSPLAKFPGPKIAALTSLYCAYHDIIEGGRYIWVVQEMHRQYGPIVRIMPDVIHVNDPSFIDKIYTQSHQSRRERAQTVLNFFSEHMSVLPTRDHDLHRRRRAVLSPFFSKQNVRRLAPVIDETCANLLRRIRQMGKSGEIARINPAIRAATKDVIQSYALGDGPKCLDMDDFNAAFFATLSSERATHVAVHFNFFMMCMIKLPPAVLRFLNPQIIAFINFVEGLGAQIDRIKLNQDESEGSTVFHEILNSDIPDSEKSTPRLRDEAMVLAIAGADTTAMTLTALIYHVLADKTIFTRLRKELDSVMPDPHSPADPIKLDQLPFLNALIEECLRMYPSATHRQDRVAPDEDLVYTYPSGRTLMIPRGTMVGMTAPLVNRHPSWHEAPDVFQPDRYLNRGNQARNHFTFSKGTRQCLGMNLAYQELQTFTAGIFRTYSLYQPGAINQGPTLELFETSTEDISLWSDYVSVGLKPGSQGVRVRIREE